MKKIYIPLLFLPIIGHAQWQLPSPIDVKHPGAEEAPLSSPLTYPDEGGFKQRAEIVIQGVSQGNLEKWRQGYFKGGDPGKYLPGHAMAKLLADPEDPEPALYLNDNRSYKEHYHFAAVNWARFLPIFGTKVLTEETQQNLSDTAFRYGSYKNHNGTENHRVMWWTTANVLPHYLVGDRGLSFQSKEETLANAKRTLHQYVKGLYAAGQGEWDSSTYLMFDMNGLLNIYDFSPDPESRLLAKAALDYLAASYAQKYTNGIYAGPHQRGFPKPPHENLADQSGYLWWGSTHPITAEDTRTWRYALHALTSSWRPNEILYNIATRKNLPLPLEQKNSKPNYWHGQQRTPKPGASHESVYITETFTLGSLWDQHASQHSRFNIVTRDGHIFSGGHPRKSDHNNQPIGLGYQDGTGRYVQSAQAGPLYLCMAVWPEDEEAAYTYFTYPDDLEPVEMKGWQVFQTSSTTVAVKPISSGGKVEKIRVEDKKHGPQKMLRFPAEDHQSGFLVWVGDPSLLEKLDTVDVTYDPSKTSVLVRVPDVHEIDFVFNPGEKGVLPGSRSADVKIDGASVDFSTWKIFDGPLLQQTPGLLTVSDGQHAFTIDFTGHLPVYK